MIGEECSEEIRIREAKLDRALPGIIQIHLDKASDPIVEMEAS